MRSVKSVIEKYGGKEINVSLENQEAEFSVDNIDILNKIKEEIEILGYKVKG